MRKQLEDLLSRNGELSRANSELRHKLTEIEYQIKEQKEKVSSYKSHVEHMTRVRQKQDETIDSMKVWQLLVEAISEFTLLHQLLSMFEPCLTLVVWQQ